MSNITINTTNSKNNESYTFITSLLKLLSKMNAVILGQSTVEYPRSSNTDIELNERMILKIFRLDWWMCYETSNLKDCPYSLKVSIVPNDIISVISADLNGKNINNLCIKITHSGKSNKYSSKIRNLLRTLDRFSQYNIEWKNLTSRIDGLLISEEGITAHVMLNRTANLPLTGKMLQIILVRDPLKAGSLEQMLKISMPVLGSMVPLLLTPALYDGDGNSSEISAKDLKILV